MRSSLEDSRGLDPPAQRVTQGLVARLGRHVRGFIATREPSDAAISALFWASTKKNGWRGSPEQFWDGVLSCGCPGMESVWTTRPR
jgi:hypothetical protein